MADSDDQPESRPDNQINSEALFEIESRPEEAKAVLDAGPGSGNRAGAFAFLAILVVIAAAIHYHFADPFQNRLDTQLRYHAELTMASMGTETPVAVVPSWPQDMHHNLRNDIVVYAGLAALAAYLWSRSAAARARRDAFLLHDRLASEITQLRRRIDALEGAQPQENNHDAITSARKG